MGRVYTADEHEAELARLTFGPSVAEVVYYDPEFPREGEPWAAYGYDADGKELGNVTEHDDDLPLLDDSMSIFEPVGTYGETVKFWLTLPDS